MESAFFCNVLLLGFDCENEKKKHSILFHSEMFKSPNVKGMEVIFYFLLLKMFGNETKEEFKNVWPIHSKDQSRDFKKLLHNRLLSLEKPSLDHSFHSLPPSSVRSSHFQTCSGERFIFLLWQFSTLVVRVVAEREHNLIVQKKRGESGIGQVPIFHQFHLSQLKSIPLEVSASKLQIKIKSQRFVDLAHQIATLEDIWKEQYTQSEKRIEQLQYEIKLTRQKRSSLGTLPENSQTDSIFRRVSKDWERLTLQAKENQNRRQMIKRIISKQINPNYLDSQNLSYNISSEIINDLNTNNSNHNGLQAKNVHEELLQYVQKTEKIDLNMLSKSWLIITTQMIVNQLSSVGEPLFFKGITKIRNDILEFAKNHRNQTEYLKNMNSDLYQMSSNSPIGENKNIKDLLNTPSSNQLKLFPPTPQTTVEHTSGLMTPSLYSQHQSLPKTPYGATSRKLSVKPSYSAKSRNDSSNSLASEEKDESFGNPKDIFQLSPSFVRIGKTLTFDVESPPKTSAEYEDELAQDEEFLQMMDRRSNISKEELSLSFDLLSDEPLLIDNDLLYS
eukprot:TRINITY_DN1014_c0_g1_i1.p1 TRINITY_DN1014_c0_g1~~TRINITY_DN1014_c0_g1_i1.p1  ORF type:complete len:559 (-),score=121.56 TRINITY_DN1014_c0_g1_i1:1037-2713(-)